ncbi:MAG: hypothetical protein ACXV8X_15725, partial [Candidatus Angelobacter sp.]
MAFIRIRHKQGQGNLSTDAEINVGSAEPPPVADPVGEAKVGEKKIGETKVGDLAIGESKIEEPALPRADAADGLAHGAVTDAAETTVIEVPRLTRALRHRDFRLFWTGNFLSNIGTW